MRTLPQWRSTTYYMYIRAIEQCTHINDDRMESHLTSRILHRKIASQLANSFILFLASAQPTIHHFYLCVRHACLTNRSISRWSCCISARTFSLLLVDMLVLPLLLLLLKRDYMRGTFIDNRPSNRTYAVQTLAVDVFVRWVLARWLLVVQDELINDFHSPYQLCGKCTKEIYFMHQHKKKQMTSLLLCDIYKDVARIGFYWEGCGLCRFW